MEIEQVSDSGPSLFLDGKSNAIDNLEMTEHFLLLDRPGRWKWATLSMCLALYGFGLVALAGTDAKWHLADKVKQRQILNLSTYERKSVDEIVEATGYTEASVIEALADPHVIGVDKVLVRLDPGWLKWLKAQDERLAQILEGSAAKEPTRPAMVKSLLLTDEQRKSIWFLIKYIRNPFEHFMPQSWSIFLPGLLESLLDMLGAIEQLIQQWHVLLNCEEERDSLVGLCGRIRALLVAEGDVLRASASTPTYTY